MKKLFTIMPVVLLALIMAFSAVAEGDALDAFRQLTGQDVLSDVQNPVAVKSGAQYLDDVMSGIYSVGYSDASEAQDAASTLAGLSAITTQDLAAYAAARGLTVRQVRNAYYRSLANVLRAEIALNPGSEERYRSVQVILSLFLNNDDVPINDNARVAIRRNMTPEYAASIAKGYDLPTDFVTFIIMDDMWDDDDWENDDDWDDNDDYVWAWGEMSNGGSALGEGDRDDASSSRIAELQERLILLGYLSGKADGIFGQRTQAALREFQLSNGLKPSGYYDDDDARRLFADDVVARWNYVEGFYDSDDDEYYDDLYDDSDDDRDYTDSRDDDRDYTDSRDDDRDYVDSRDDDRDYADSRDDDRDYSDSRDDDRDYSDSRDDDRDYSDSNDDDRPSVPSPRPQKSYDDSDDDSYSDSYEDSDD